MQFLACQKSMPVQTCPKREGHTVELNSIGLSAETFLLLKELKGCISGLWRVQDGSHQSLPNAAIGHQNDA